VELFDARQRLPYKAAKVRSYWPEVSPADRQAHLYSEWREIAARLDHEIAGVEAVLPRLEATAKAWEIKAYEDTLDAIVCAWVATCALDGRATPFGDENAAIWIPTMSSRLRQDRRSGEKLL
jgi:predicted RNase H-like nuclease